MKKHIQVIALLLFAINLKAQYKVQFRFKRLPSYHQTSDTIFLAGSFNRWNPKNNQFACVRCNEKNGITIDLPRGMFEYKFTHGSWEGVEAGNDGTPTENR